MRCERRHNKTNYRVFGVLHGMRVSETESGRAGVSDPISLAELDAAGTNMPGCRRMCRGRLTADARSGWAK